MKNLVDVSKIMMEENIPLLQEILSKSQKLNRENELLKAKYNHDVKYARIHKRLTEKGDFKKNQPTLLVEDLATDGGSKITFVNAIREAGLEIKDIFVIFYYDIFNFEKSDLSKLNVKIHSLCTWKNIVTYLEKGNIYSELEINSLKEFLNDPSVWRKKNG